MSEVGGDSSVGAGVGADGVDDRIDALSLYCCSRRRPRSVFINSDSILALHVSVWFRNCW